MRWMIGTILVLGLCSGLGYASYVVWYQPVTNWLGYPTRAQQNEFFEFAEKIGYRPENQLGFNHRMCSDFMPQSCSMILIFAVDTPLYEPKHPDLEVTNSSEGTARSQNLMAAFNGAGLALTLDGKSRSDLPRSPDYPRTSWAIRDVSTNYTWGFSHYQTSEYGYSVEINGSTETRDFVMIFKRFK